MPWKRFGEPTDISIVDENGNAHTFNGTIESLTMEPGGITTGEISFDTTSCSLDNFGKSFISIGDSIRTFGERSNINIPNVNASSEEELIQKILERFNKVPIMKHSCNGCGATLEMDINNHLFACPYCGSAYAIGTTQIWSS